MKIGFVIFDGMTALDFIGVFDPLTRLYTMNFMTDLRWDIYAYSEQVIDGTGLRFQPTRVRVPLSGNDMVVVPGGHGTRALARDPDFINWIGTAADCRYKVSVCTGSVLLGAAGFLRGKRATTHRLAFDDLKPYCEAVVDERIVDEGDMITARGVSSSIDLGLYLCEKFAGHDVKEHIRRQMDYGQ